MSDAEKVTIKTQELVYEYFTLNLIDFICDLNRILMKIPREYRNSATIRYDEDGCDCTLEIEYSKPETESEALARIEAAENRVKLKEIEERRLLAELKRKYEK